MSLGAVATQLRSMFRSIVITDTAVPDAFALRIAVVTNTIGTSENKVDEYNGHMQDQPKPVAPAASRA